MYGRKHTVITSWTKVGAAIGGIKSLCFMSKYFQTGQKVVLDLGVRSSISEMIGFQRGKMWNILHGKKKRNSKYDKSLILNRHQTLP